MESDHERFEPRRGCRCTSASCSPRAARRGRSALRDGGTTLHEDEDIRLWTLDDEVLIASIKTKMHAISPEVCEGLQQAVEMAEKEYQGLVIWSPDEPFSAGADLESMLPAFMRVGVARSRMPKAACSRPCCGCATRRCRWCPRSAAWRWAAAASWRCIRPSACAAMESYIGLVEVGVGLVPGAGGLTYIARRAAENAARQHRQATCCRS